MRGDLRRTRSILRTINKMHQITRGIPLARDVVITSYLPQVQNNKPGTRGYAFEWNSRAFSGKVEEKIEGARVDINFIRS